MIIPPVKIGFGHGQEGLVTLPYEKPQFSSLYGDALATWVTPVKAACLHQL
jgi:hypothetical protein